MSLLPVNGRLVKRECPGRKEWWRPRPLHQVEHLTRATIRKAPSTLVKSVKDMTKRRKASTKAKRQRQALFESGGLRSLFPPITKLGELNKEDTLQKHPTWRMETLWTTLPMFPHLSCPVAERQPRKRLFLKMTYQRSSIGKAGQTRKWNNPRYLLKQLLAAAACRQKAIRDAETMKRNPSVSEVSEKVKPSPTQKRVPEPAFRLDDPTRVSHECEIVEKVKPTPTQKRAPEPALRQDDTIVVRAKASEREDSHTQSHHSKKEIEPPPTDR